MLFKHFLLVVGILIWCRIAKSRSESRLCLQPLPGPEVRYDLYACSIVLDWKQYITQDCRQSITDYEVQYINECTGDDLSQSRNQINHKGFEFPEKIPGECSVDTNCYVRMRFRLNDASWSKFSAWTTLSNNYEATQSNFKFHIYS